MESTHVHGKDCGHTQIKHGDHVDFLQEGHLQHPRGSGNDDHVIEISGANPNACTSGHECQGHDADHHHGPGCGHQAIPHGDHTDYIVDDHLHHAHGDHCDDHGPVRVVH